MTTKRQFSTTQLLNHRPAGYLEQNPKRPTPHSPSITQMHSQLATSITPKTLRKGRGTSVTFSCLNRMQRHHSVQRRARPAAAPRRRRASCAALRAAASAPPCGTGGEAGRGGDLCAARHWRRGVKRRGPVEEEGRGGEWREEEMGEGGRWMRKTSRGDRQERKSLREMSG